VFFEPFQGLIKVEHKHRKSSRYFHPAAFLGGSFPFVKTQEECKIVASSS
jgi:hypothetical protein